MYFIVSGKINVFKLHSGKEGNGHSDTKSEVIDIVHVQYMYC